MPLSSTTTVWEGKSMAQRGRTPLVLLGVLLLTSLLIAPEASPWGSAIHTYIDDHLGKSRPFRNVNEMYGGAAPDVFNTMFDQKAWMDFLYGETHNNFLKLWEAAHLQLGKAAAFGFVSHNDVWGADSTAHHRCASAQCDEGDGYVVAKAKEMLLPQAYGDYLLNGLGLPYPVALELCHNIVESALDLLIKKNDPTIGKKLATAALLRAPQFPFLLVEAYAHDFSHQFSLPPSEAVKVILEAEMNFRKTSILYGQVLMQDDATATYLVAEQLAAQAVGFLGSFGLTLPIPPQDVPGVIEGLLVVATGICKDDYFDEIQGTIRAVDIALRAHGLWY
jgi:hypothetical protein